MTNPIFPTSLVWQASSAGNESGERFTIHDLYDLVDAVFPGTRPAWAESQEQIQEMLRPEIERQFPGLSRVTLEEAKKRHGPDVFISMAQTVA